uniref:Uncharacterized protein n=1 Tax=Romanomermis culicivorax TaxID=13658 RepID=A0A915JQI2_ROMCU
MLDGRNGARTTKNALQKFQDASQKDRDCIAVFSSASHFFQDNLRKNQDGRLCPGTLSVPLP